MTQPFLIHSNDYFDHVIQWFRTFSLIIFAIIFVSFSHFWRGTPVNTQNRYENVAYYLVLNFRENFVPTRIIIEYLIMFTERIALLCDALSGDGAMIKLRWYYPFPLCWLKNKTKHIWFNSMERRKMISLTYWKVTTICEYLTP